VLHETLETNAKKQEESAMTKYKECEEKRKKNGDKKMKKKCSAGKQVLMKLT
jgi:hypothetical protein